MYPEDTSSRSTDDSSTTTAPSNNPKPAQETVPSTNKRISNLQEEINSIKINLGKMIQGIETANEEFDGLVKPTDFMAYNDAVNYNKVFELMPKLYKQMLEFRKQNNFLRDVIDGVDGLAGTGPGFFSQDLKLNFSKLSTQLRDTVADNEALYEDFFSSLYYLVRPECQSQMDGEIKTKIEEHKKVDTDFSAMLANYEARCRKSEKKRKFVTLDDLNEEIISEQHNAAKRSKASTSAADAADIQPSCQGSVTMTAAGK